jgi:hypothetical protein
MKDTIIEVRYMVEPTLESVLIQSPGSIKTYISINEYIDYMMCDHNNSTGSQNPLVSDDAIKNSVIELDELQQVFAKVKLLLMEHPSFFNTSIQGKPRQCSTIICLCKLVGF